MRCHLVGEVGCRGRIPSLCYILPHLVYIVKFWWNIMVRAGSFDKALYCSSWELGNVLDLPCWAMDSLVELCSRFEG